ASVGVPVLAEAPAPAAAPAMLIDAKVGELNGRPVRADEVLNVVGSDLRATALARKFTLAQWTFVRGSEPDPSQADKEISRAQWLAYAQQKIGFELAQRLRDQLLAEEARASLKPEQKQGLRYMVQEATETARREAGGSRAEAQRRLREKSTSEHELE